MNKSALCIIVEGDQKLDGLKIAVDSAKDFVDEVCITANGKSTTETKEYCKKNGFKYSFLEWKDNFAEQRNFNFAQASIDVDYILWLDSDDQLVGGEYLPKIFDLARRKEYDQVFFTYWYGNRFVEGKERNYENLIDIELYHNRERIIKRNKIKWVGRLHETPVEFDGSKLNYTGIKHTLEDPHPVFPIAVLHRDATRHSDAENEVRGDRNKRLLEKQLNDEREAGKIDPRTVLYLMKIYAYSKSDSLHKKCIALGEEYLTKSGWDEERATALILVSSCFYYLGHYERAKATLLGALDEWPQNKEIYLALANVSFSLGKYDDMKTYMDIASAIEPDKKTAGNRNIIDWKFKSLMLDLKYNLNVVKKIKKAFEAAEKIYEIEPSEKNLEQLNYLSDLSDYNDACEHIDLFTRYLAKAKLYDELNAVLDNFPAKFKELPFYNKLINSYSKPKTWADNEICYYASFGGDHFEKWDPSSLKDGIGGSETAVIKLAKEWTSLGFKVTVYGDPKKEGVYDGVTYKSFRRFNPKDRFNIFIQWRSGFLANKIVAKKFFVDLHDVFSEQDYLDILPSIDKIFVKSQYQRSLAPNIPDDKFVIISNGI